MTKREKFYYLASPYSHAEPRIRHERYLAVLDCKAWFLKQKIWVYSPIVHCHETARLHSLPTDVNFWKEYNHAMIDRLTGVLVLCIKGSGDSRGVRDEMEYAWKTGKTVETVTPNDAGGYERSVVPANKGGLR